MPRSGVNGTYTLPPNTDNQQPLTPISSSMFNAAMDDVEQTFNTPTPISYGGTGASDAVGARAELGVDFYDGAMGLTPAQQVQARANIGADLLGGFRNKLINALGTINQRGYASGAATSGSNQYTLDRWRVVVSGQNLSWTESEGVRTMTAPAGGVEQVIEGTAILSGDHVLNWEGTATATVDGNAVTKGGVFTLTGGTNATVRFIGGTFAKPQLEEGVSPTQFEIRPIGVESTLCRRYFERVTGASYLFGAGGVGWTYRQTIYLVPKRSTPSVSITDISPQNINTVSAGGAAVDKFHFNMASSAANNSCGATFTWEADAEL